MVNNMENSEEVMQILERFTRLKQKEIPKELDEYLLYVAKTGDTIFKWSSLKYLFREKLLNVIKHFHDTTPRVDEIPQYPNVDPFNYESMKSSLLERLELFTAAPFTVQRLCELLIDPRKQYSRIDKFMRALEKNILVSTIEPGRKRTESENGDSLDSMVNGDLSLDVNVDIDMEGESLFNIEAQNGNGNGAGNGTAADTDNGANGADSAEGEADASTTVPVAAVAAEVKKKALALLTPNVPHTVEDEMQPNPKKAKLDLDDDDEVKPKETSATAGAAASAAVVTASATVTAAESVAEVKTVGKAEDAKPAATAIESTKGDMEQTDVDGAKTAAASATAPDDVEIQENKENKSSSGKSNDDVITTDKPKVDVDEGNPKAEKEKQKIENKPDTEAEKKDVDTAQTAEVEDKKKPAKPEPEKTEVEAAIKEIKAAVKDCKEKCDKVVEKQEAEKGEKEKTPTKVDAEAAAAETNTEKEAVEELIDPKLDDEGKEKSDKVDEAKSVTVEEKNAELAVGDVAKAADKEEAKTKSSAADDSTASLKKSPHLETKTNEVVAEKASQIEGKSTKEPTASVEGDAVSSPSSNVTTTAALTIAKSDEQTAAPVDVKEKAENKDDYAAVGSTNVKACAVGVAAAAKAVVDVANAAAPSLGVEPKPSTTIKAADVLTQQCEKIETEPVGAVAVAAPQAPTVDSTATKIDEDIAAVASTIAAAVATPALALNDQPMEDVAPLDEMPALLPVNEVVMTESSGATDMATDVIEPSKDEPAGMEVDDTSQEEAMDQ